MRDLACLRLEIDQHRRDGIRHDGASGEQDAMASFAPAFDVELIIEVRSIASFDFKEDDAFFRIEAVQDAESLVGLVAVLVRIGLRIPGNQADNLIDIICQYFLRGVVQVNPGNAEFRRAKGAGKQRSQNDAEDENRGDLKSLGTLEDICPGGVNEDERYQDKNPAGRAFGGGHRYCAGAGSHQNQNACRVSASLRIHICVKKQGDGYSDSHEDQYQRA